MKHILLIIIVFNTFLGFTQQDPIFSQYIFVPTSINPAFAGQKEDVSFTLMSRHQWIGFDGAPSTQTLVADVPLNDSKSGFGFVVVSDRLGPVKNNVFYLDYAYRIQVARNHNVSFGLRGGISLYSVKLSNLDAIHENDELIQDVNNKVLPNIGLGLNYFTDRYYVSISIPRLLRDRITDISSDENSRYERHFYIMGGWKFKINRTTEFNPALVARIVGGAPASFDINASILYDKLLTLGLLYRIGDAIGFIVQFEFLEHYKLGYSLDYSLGSIGRESFGTHEFLLAYKFRPRRSIMLKLF